MEIEEMETEEIREWIPMERCIHGGLYKVSARNIGYGVWNEDSKMFHGIRYKFSDEYIDGEWHWDVSYPMLGTVKPIEFIKQCPYEFPWAGPIYGVVFSWLKKETEL